MADSNNRNQVLIAVIGLMGVLGTALIANWEKIFSKPNPTVTDKQPAGSSSPSTDVHKKRPVSPVPAPVKPDVAPKPRTYSIDGRMVDQANGKILCTGRVSAQVGDVHQVQLPDVEGRYAFEFEGFAPEDELILNAQVPDHQELHLTWKLSQLDHLQNLAFARTKPSGPAMGAIIGAMAGGGKGAATSSRAGGVKTTAPVPPACADSRGPAPAYQARPDASRLEKRSQSP